MDSTTTRSPGDYLSLYTDPFVKKNMRECVVRAGRPCPFRPLLHSPYPYPYPYPKPTTQPHILFSDIVIKINRKGRPQDRVFLVTTAGIYNLSPTQPRTCKRRIDLRAVAGVTVSGVSNEFVLHVPAEYDYRISASRKLEAINAIVAANAVLTGGGGKGSVSVHVTDAVDLGGVTTLRTMAGAKKRAGTLGRGGGAVVDIVDDVDSGGPMLGSPQRPGGGAGAGAGAGGGGAGVASPSLAATASATTVWASGGDDGDDDDSDDGGPPFRPLPLIGGGGGAGMGMGMGTGTAPTTPLLNVAASAAGPSAAPVALPPAGLAPYPPGSGQLPAHALYTALPGAMVTPGGALPPALLPAASSSSSSASHGDAGRAQQGAAAAAAAQLPTYLPSSSPRDASGRWGGAGGGAGAGSVAGAGARRSVSPPDFSERDAVSHTGYPDRGDGGAGWGGAAGASRAGGVGVGVGGGAASRVTGWSTPESPVRLDDFELLRVVGRGSYGKVLLVRKKDSGEVLAMKVLRKSVVVARNQVEHTQAERAILESIDHPFLCHLRYAFQTDSKLYLVLPYLRGGEVFHHLKQKKRFDEPLARFYAAEIVLGLGHLHAVGIVYRDLKPENVLLDAEGHVRLTDFGLAKVLAQPHETANTFCGTPEYLAPEVIEGYPHDKGVDWWALGVLLWEMLTGLPPFYNANVQVMYEMIRAAELRFPAAISPLAQSLLSDLLARDPARRLGNRAGDGDGEAVKAHPFFADIDWAALYERRVPPPWRPAAVGSADISHFDKEFTGEAVGGGGGSAGGSASAAASAAAAAGALLAGAGGAASFQAPHFEGFSYAAGGSGPMMTAGSVSL
jgi:hypothetical protein